MRNILAAQVSALRSRYAVWTGASLVTAAIAVALVWSLTNLIAGSETRTVIELQARNAVREQLIQLALGLVVAATLVYLTREFARSQRHRRHLTDQSQILERYTKAVDQLNSDRLNIRVGGVYALEALARDFPGAHPAAIGVLAAIIREYSTRPSSASASTPDASQELRSPDVEAAISVLRRRNATLDRGPLDLAGADLRMANLNHTDLNGASLASANLAGANLVGAFMTRADLGGADLSGANLNHADIAVASLRKADLTGANLARANLAFADLVGANLAGADLTEAGLTETDLTSANLTGAIFPVAGVTLPPGWVQRPSGFVEGTSRRSDDIQ